MEKSAIALPTFRRSFFCNLLLLISAFDLGIASLKELWPPGVIGAIYSRMAGAVFPPWSRIMLNPLLVKLVAIIVFDIFVNDLDLFFGRGLIRFSRLIKNDLTERRHFTTILATFRIP